MRMILTSSLVCSVGLAVTASTAATQPARREARLTGVIRPEWIAGHVRYLADPLLEGRETATRGGELAAKYVASQFETLGLEPLGKDGGYLLPVPLRVSKAIPAKTALTFTAGGRSTPWQWGREFFLHADKERPDATLAGGVVFVGWGVSAPSDGYDDYRGVDVRGQWVAMFFGGPQALGPDQRGYYASLTVKEAAARAHGAIGVITLLPGPGQLIEEKFDQLEGFSWLDGDRPQTIFFERHTTIRLADSGVVKLFAAAGRDWTQVLDQLNRGPVSFPIDATIRLETAFEHRATSASNVAGVLKGSDPILKNEYLVYSAHLDHVGNRPSMAGGDSIYYGAIDNAGGTASVLAIARAHTLLPRPKRSVIFLAVTGEEKGILGSDYFVARPPVPARSLVANVNLDNFVMIHPIRDLVAYGAGYSTLAEHVRSAFKRLAIEPSEDPLPWMTIFTRSDHYAFMRRGIPGVMLFPGKRSGDGTRDGSATQRTWFDTIHHTPRDRFDQGIDWTVGAKYAETNFLIGYGAANAKERPSWKPGPDFFKAAAEPKT